MIRSMPWANPQKSPVRVATWMPQCEKGAEWSKPPHSLFQPEGADYTDYIEILENSKTTGTQLNDVVAKFRSRGLSRKRKWDQLRLATKNLDETRSKPTLHVSLRSAYLGFVDVNFLGRVTGDVRDLPTLKDTVDKFGADEKSGRREGSVMTVEGDADQAIWQELS